MDREELLKWLKIGEEILTKNDETYRCPCNADHYISFELIFYPEFKKKELVLMCKVCNKKHIISAEMK